MRRLTDDELREPDVTLIIPLDKWRNLSDGIKAELSHCIDRGNYTTHVYTVPAYLARQFEQEMRHTLPGVTHE